MLSSYRILMNIRLNSNEISIRRWYRFKYITQCFFFANDKTINLEYGFGSYRNVNTVNGFCLIKYLKKLTTIKPNLFACNILHRTVFVPCFTNFFFFQHIIRILHGDIEVCDHRHLEFIIRRSFSF